MRQKRSSKSGHAATAITSIASSTTFHLDSPDRPFDNILNFRDVGKSINEFVGSKILKEDILFRSARTDDASERDRQRLQDDIGLSTMIDLRSNTEHEMAARRRRNSLPTSSLEGANIANTLLLIESIFWSCLVRVDTLSVLLDVHLRDYFCGAWTGYRADAVKIIASQVMKPRGLIGLAQDTLDCAGAEIREIFDVLTKDDSYPVLIHCTQGKDRTGLIILILLFLVADVSLAPSEAQQQPIPLLLDAIASDYMKSEIELQPEFESLMKEIADIGLDEEYAKTPPGFTEALKSYLDTKYGGVRRYLLSIGVGEEKIDKIARILMV